VQEDLRRVGIEAGMHLVGWTTLMESVARRGVVPMASMNAPATDDPKDYLDLLLNGGNITDVWSSNLAFYSNEVVQRLLGEASVARDPAHRIGIYREVERRIVEDAPWIFSCHADFEMALQRWVRGARIAPLWPPARFENCWLER